MATGFGVLLILFGGLMMVIGYQTFPGAFPGSSGDSALWFALGALIAMLGILMLVGADVVRVLKKLQGLGYDSEQWPSDESSAPVVVALGVSAAQTVLYRSHSNEPSEEETVPDE